MVVDESQKLERIRIKTNQIKNAIKELDVTIKDFEEGQAFDLLRLYYKANNKL